MEAKIIRLRKFNVVMAVLHAFQGAAVLILATDFALPITVNYLAFDQASQSLLPASQTLFNLPLAYLVAGFFFISALFHLTISTGYFATYAANLKLGLNKARWYEYSLSASTMIVAIALLVGIYDIGTLLALFGLTAVMNLCGLLMESRNQETRQTDWSPFWVGSIAGIIPWVIIAVLFWAAARYGSGAIPTFVYWIYVSIFIFFNSFAINMALQYKQVGKWREYLYGERAYIWLSLIAKSALAWQVFAGTLRP